MWSLFQALGPSTTVRLQTPLSSCFLKMGVHPGSWGGKSASPKPAETMFCLCLVCHTLMKNCPVGAPRGPSETYGYHSQMAASFLWGQSFYVVQNWAHFWQYAPQIKTP